MDFRAFALSTLKEFRLLVEGSLVNLRRAAFRRHSLLNQDMLRLFEGEVFSIVTFAIAIKISVTCFIRAADLGPVFYYIKVYIVAS